MRPAIAHALALVGIIVGAAFVVMIVVAETTGVTTVVLIGLIVGFVCGGVSSAIAEQKSLSRGAYFLVGFFFGVIGIVVAAVVPNGQPGPPAGMIGTRCPRCNAQQNVSRNTTSVKCWQCSQDYDASLNP